MSTKPRLRGGNAVKIFQVFKDAIHGAYEGPNDTWIPLKWDGLGQYDPERGASNLDLIYGPIQKAKQSKHSEEEG